jgi:hypothetical protein
MFTFWIGFCAIENFGNRKKTKKKLKREIIKTAKIDFNSDKSFHQTQALNIFEDKFIEKGICSYTFVDID